MSKARNANVNSAISIASLVIVSLKNEDFNLNQWLKYHNYYEEAIKKWVNPNKRTLVHDYVEAVYLEDQNYILGKHYVIDVIKEIQELLENYSIDYSSIGYIDVSEMGSDDGDDTIEEYAEKLQSFFIDNLLDVIVDDAFTVLYSNKNFLHEFNRQCSEVIKGLHKKDYPDVLKEDGVIKRITYYPKWMKKGIEYRDKLRCSICGCDLSSAFTTLTDENFDHIIPLQIGGNNDPSNWQIACEGCNKSKGDRNSQFKNIVFPFWEIT